MKCLIAIALVAAAACGGRPDPRTREEATARGDELLRKMSDTLKNAQAEQRSFRLAYVGAFVLVLVYAETPLVHLLLSQAAG